MCSIFHGLQRDELHEHQRNPRMVPEGSAGAAQTSPGLRDGAFSVLSHAAHCSQSSSEGNPCIPGSVPSQAGTLGWGRCPWGWQELSWGAVQQLHVGMDTPRAPCPCQPGVPGAGGWASPAPAMAVHGPSSQQQGTAGPAHEQGSPQLPF